MADPNRQICLCFHVSERKIANFIRIEQPKRVAQLSDCFGAGTGCGWCRPFLQKMFEQALRDGQTALDLPTDEEYAHLRRNYVREGGGTPPPGATPIEDDDADS